jgi:hypothetical protein
MFTQRFTVPLATSAGGTQTTTTTDQGVNGQVNGRILEVYYVPDGTVPLATGAVVTLTGETTGIPILTVTGIGTTAVNYAPRQATHTIAGAASLYASGGTAVTDHIYIANERVQVTISSGGASKSGTLYIVVG